MQIRALAPIRGTHGAYNPGQAAEVELSVGLAWIAAGVAEAITRVDVETATLAAPEAATAKRRAPRTAPTENLETPAGSDEPAS